jgi:hypothetical protein
MSEAKSNMKEMEFKNKISIKALTVGVYFQSMTVLMEAGAVVCVHMVMST